MLEKGRSSLAAARSGDFFGRGFATVQVDGCLTRATTQGSGMNRMTRRDHLGLIGALGLAGIAMPVGAQAVEPFSWPLLQARAQRLARGSWRGEARPDPAAARIDYDAASRLAFDYDHALWRARDDGYAVGFFPLVAGAPRPVSISVVEGGRATPLAFDRTMFVRAPGAQGDLPDLPHGFSGLRLMNRRGIGDWLAFMGASYFRSAGPLHQYGLSARGLAIDCGTSSPEEFPTFTDFWLEQGRDSVIIYALLDSRRATGAFRFVNRQTADEMVQDVSAVIHLRDDVERLCVAPLTSMFWYGEGNRAQGIDWRPEVHDSDGLALLTGSGERIWRPLVNPPRPTTNAFEDRGPRGYGLLQRDRAHDHYQDDGVWYDKRPSLWVEPKGDWGPGSVMLYELPTAREVDDNIVAWWTPAGRFRRGARYAYDYRLRWIGGEPIASAARATDLWTGSAGPAGLDPIRGARRIVADFRGSALDSLGSDSGVTAEVEVGRGQLIMARAYPVQGSAGLWRLVADVKLATGELTDIRAKLKRGEAYLGETLVYQLHPLAG